MTAVTLNNTVACPTSQTIIHQPATLEDLKAALQRQASVTLGAQTQGGADSLTRMSEAVQSIQSPSAGNVSVRPKMPHRRGGFENGRILIV